MQSKKTTYLALVGILFAGAALAALLAAGQTLTEFFANDFHRLGMRSSLLFIFGENLLKYLLSVYSVVIIIAVSVAFLFVVSRLIQRYIVKGIEIPENAVFQRVFNLVLSAGVWLAITATGLYCLIQIHHINPLSPRGVFYYALLFIGGLALFFILLRVLTGVDYPKLGNAFSRVFSSRIMLWAGGMIALAGLGFTFIVSPLCASLISRGRPNVILIVFDTLRRDHLGVYNPACGLTPNIDEFAEESVVFDRVTAQGPCTINSAPSMLASVYLSEHGFVNYRTKISDKLLMAAEIMRDAGLKTVSISTNIRISHKFNMQQGFGKIYEFDESTYASKVNRTFKRWAERNASSPFHAMLWYMDTHIPYGAPEYFYRDVLGEESDMLQHDFLNAQYSNNALDSLGREDIKRLYRESVQYIDYEFGNLIEFLKAKELYDNSLIIFTSDHGELFWEYRNILGHELCGHSNSLNAELIDIPFIVKFPQSSRSGLVKNRVNSIDMLPTMMQVVGIENQAVTALQRGTNLLPFLEDDSRPGTNNYCHSEHILISERADVRMNSVLNDDYKLVTTYRLNGETMEPPLMQLLDLKNGEEELEVEEGSALEGIRDELWKEHYQWEESLKPYHTLKLRMRPAEEKALREKLKALGYIK